MDGTGKRNSPFTEAFLNNVNSSEPLSIIVTRITSETLALTAQRQRPYISGTMGSDNAYYSLNPAEGGAPGPRLVASAPQAPVQAVPPPSTAQPVAVIPAPEPVSNEMILVEGGTFQMGSTKGDNDEKPVHAVTVKGFYMSKFEVTQREWFEIMGHNPSSSKGDNRPVDSVTWNEAVEYCNRRSIKEGLKPAYSSSDGVISCDWSADGYRLPTEAEWEFAAKGGNKDVMEYMYSGSNSVDAVAWYENNSENTTHDVGSKMPNSLGLYDMSGNVYEWCWDLYGTSYSRSGKDNPTGNTSGSDRVFRGGSRNNAAKNVRSSYRARNTPAYRDSCLGFRLVRPQ
jgi:formylglycine-generating enzyme required for sulfatase activity